MMLALEAPSLDEPRPPTSELDLIGSPAPPPELGDLLQRFGSPSFSELTSADLMALLVMWAEEQQDRRPGRPLGRLGRSPGTPQGVSSGGRPHGAQATNPERSPASTAPPAPLAGVPSGGSGDRLAAIAEERLKPSDKGKCATYVRQALAAAGLVPGNVAFRSAHQWADYLANSSSFQEVSVSRDQLQQLPRGAVVVWGGVAGD